MPFLAGIGSAVTGGSFATGAALTGSAAFGAGVVGAGVLGGAALIGTSLLSGGGGTEDFNIPALPPTPSFEEAQGTSLEEQRENLRRKSKTVLTPTNLLETQGDVTQKTLLGA